MALGCLKMKIILKKTISDDGSEEIEVFSKGVRMCNILPSDVDKFKELAQYVSDSSHFGNKIEWIYE